MKILFISFNSPGLSIGGVERHIKNLIDYCICYDKEAVFLLPSCKKESEEKIGNVAIIKKENVGIVNAQNFHFGLPPIYSLMLNMACFLENVPMVMRMHSFIKTDMQKSLVNDLSWEKILCVSKSVAGDCFSKGINIDRLHTQHLGVNKKDFRPF